MLTHDPFYHKSIYNLVAAFGNIFNDIWISRKDSSEVERKRIKVPISYGPKEKWLVRDDQDPELAKQKAILLPRMGFEITTISADPIRQFNKTYRIAAQSSDNRHRKFEYNPAPFNVDFSLYVLTKNVEDGLQIIEQILPFFKPMWTVTIDVIPEMNMSDDVPIILKNLHQEDSYDGGFEQRRTTSWTLDFTAKVNFYGPLSNQSIIRQTITDLHAVSGAGPVTDTEVQNTPRIARIEVTPVPSDAEPEDEYGFLEVLTEYNDGKKFDPVLGIDVSIRGNTCLIGSKAIGISRNGVSSR